MINRIFLLFYSWDQIQILYNLMQNFIVVLLDYLNTFTLQNITSVENDQKNYKRIINECLFVVIILISRKDYGKLGSNVVINDDTFENGTRYLHHVIKRWKVLSSHIKYFYSVLLYCLMHILTSSKESSYWLQFNRIQRSKMVNKNAH